VSHWGIGEGRGTIGNSVSNESRLHKQNEPTFLLKRKNLRRRFRGRVCRCVGMYEGVSQYEGVDGREGMVEVGVVRVESEDS